MVTKYQLQGSSVPFLDRTNAKITFKACAINYDIPYFDVSKTHILTYLLGLSYYLLIINTANANSPKIA